MVVVAEVTVAVELDEPDALPEALTALPEALIEPDDESGAATEDTDGATDGATELKLEPRLLWAVTAESAARANVMNCMVGDGVWLTK